jgi:methylenetetrahydrofolate reductase (NADPH)
MRIDEAYANRTDPVFSFEFFPPKTEEGERNLYTALGELRQLEPAFVSVTYGAGGSTRDKTIEIVRTIKHDYDLEAMAHFTCVNATVDELRSTLDALADAGIDNVLALRGDPPAGQEEWTKTEGGFEYSHELVSLIRDDYPFSIGAACFPETHIHATSPEDDLRHLKSKVDAGAQFLITQLFFDNDVYFDFVDRARAIGIEVPIVPGIWPIINVAQIERVTALSKARLPDELRRELHAREEDPEAVAEFGVAYATLQCAELLAGGAPGIHFYTLNRSPATRAILSALRLTRPWERLTAGPASGPHLGPSGTRER